MKNYRARSGPGVGPDPRAAPRPRDGRCTHDDRMTACRCAQQAQTQATPTQTQHTRSSENAVLASRSPSRRRAPALRTLIYLSRLTLNSSF